MSEESLQKIIKHLDSEEASDVAGSALTLSVIFQQGPPEAFTSVDGLSAKLLSLLRSNDAAIKNNALAALSAGIEVSQDIANEAISEGAVPLLMDVLSSAANDLPEEKSLCINVLGTIGSLGEASSKGLEELVKAGALEEILQLCLPNQISPLLESAVDSVCKLLASGPIAVQASRDAGAISVLGSLLSHDVGDEVLVRALIGLGMLLQDGDASCVALATTDGAVGALLRLARQDRDGDVQQIAGHMFRELGKCEAAKEAILQGLGKSSHQ